MSEVESSVEADASLTVRKERKKIFFFSAKKKIKILTSQSHVRYPCLISDLYCFVDIAINFFFFHHQ
jgi:hypothetical protein